MPSYFNKKSVLERFKEILEQYPDDAKFSMMDTMSEDGGCFSLEAYWENAPEVEKFSHQEQVTDPRTGEPYWITVTEYLEKR